MDYTVKKVKKTKIQKLRLKNYARGCHLTALKAVHFLNDWETELSHTQIHSHDYYELVVVMHGRGKQKLATEERDFRPGDVFMLCPGEAHLYEYAEPLTLLTFMFDSSILRPMRKDLKLLPNSTELFTPGAPKLMLRVNSGVLAELDILLNNIALENRNPAPGRDLLLTALLIKVLVLILRSNAQQESFIPLNSGIGPVVSYMLRNFHRELKLPQLAAMAHLSESSFYRQFTEEFHEPPMRWLLELRLRKAREFLIRSDMTISDVARETGFDDPFYFSRQFRKSTGCTPRQYRQQNHGPLQVVRGMNVTSENIS